MMDEEATSKKRKMPRRESRITKRKKEMHPELKESVKLSDTQMMTVSSVGNFWHIYFRYLMILF
jgi:hypothetical protein